MFAGENLNDMKRQYIFYLTICLIIHGFISCKSSRTEIVEKTELLSPDELNRRLKLDFTRSKDDVKSYIRHYIPDVTEWQLRAWTHSGTLEGKNIDGQFRYFNQAAPNLFRVDSTCLAVKEAKDGGEKKLELEDVKTQIYETTTLNGVNNLFHPVKMKVTYTLTVHPDVVPAGEELRCWLPFPHAGLPRQKDIRLLSVNDGTYKIENKKNRTHAFLFMKKKAVAGQATVFSEQFEYISYAQYIKVDTAKVLPYDTHSAFYKRFTRESLPHLTLSPAISDLAKRIVGTESNPYLQAKKLFDYVDRFPWASAREYSTISNIPEYVLKYRKGDCGQQTLLFMDLCRSLGIPTHFQSGFMMHPGASNLHDWCEIYINGYGWIPVDVSFGRYPFAHNDEEAYFYLGGIDNYRMVVNQNFSGSLDGKQYPRSETVDFQRGEVEWKGGNLYFNSWNWNVDIAYEEVR